MRVRTSLVLALVAVFVAGCVVVPGSQYPEQHQTPAYGGERALLPPPPVGPPPPFREPRPNQPSPAYVWLDGYWDWDGARFFWQPGRWVVAPQGQVWEAHRWAHSSKHGWILIGGQWRDIPMN